MYLEFYCMAHSLRNMPQDIVTPWAPVGPRVPPETRPLESHCDTAAPMREETRNMADRHTDHSLASTTFTHITVVARWVQCSCRALEAPG